jgi:enamine deaminase RidA (YjgF/YER057c/UK114 family)
MDNISDASMIDLRVLHLETWQLHTLSAQAPTEVLASARHQRDVQFLLQIAFGGLPNQKNRTYAAMLPLISVQGKVTSETAFSAWQAFAVKGMSVHSIHLSDRMVAAWFEDHHARYCFLGNILPQNLYRSASIQAREVFEQMEKILEMADMAITDLVRTWLYLSNLLDWYDAFNEVRTRFFEERGVFGRLMPASTGIGAGNATGAALVAGALAIRPRKGSPCISAVPSPMQCSATQYRSAFSRAVEIAWHDARLLLISGTASITPDGRSAHMGDPQGQIALTMEVVEAILASRDMGWEQVTRTIIYLKNMAYAPLFTEYCRQQHIPPLPAVLVETDICRPELLFEIEVDAVDAVSVL